MTVPDETEAATQPPAAPDLGDRVTLTRQPNGSLRVEGLTTEERTIFLALYRALAPILAEQTQTALNAQRTALLASLEAAKKDNRDEAIRAAQVVCHQEIVARVKKVQRNDDGDIIGIIEEARRS
jgi:hypothetical protein